MTKELSITGLALFLFLAQPSSIVAQGAASSSMGLEGVAVFDGAGILQNPATLAQQETSSISIQHFNRFRVGNWNDLAIYANVATSSTAVISGAYTLKGFPGFQTHSVAVATGLSCSKKMNIGIIVDLAKNQLEEKTAATGLQANGKTGFTYAVNPKMTFGLVLQNPHRWMTRNQSPISPTQRIIAGIQYKPSEIFSIWLEADQHEHLSGINIGLQYAPVENISCRFGYKGVSKEMSGGIGIIYNSININAAVIHHPYLGISTGIAITYRIYKS